MYRTISAFAIIWALFQSALRLSSEFSEKRLFHFSKFWWNLAKQSVTMIAKVLVAAYSTCI